jgi:hypothetical protein
VVTGVHVHGEHWLVLAAQDAGNFGSHTTEDEAIGVDDMPLADHFTCFWGIRAHHKFTTFV